MWHICHVIMAIHTAALIHELGVIVRVCHEGCAQLIIPVVVVAVGESGEVAGRLALMVVVVGMEQLSVVC